MRRLVLKWLHARGIQTEAETLDERVQRAIEEIEGGLLGTHPLRSIWEDDDYLVAALAILTGDGDRARAAALASFARRPIEG